METLAIWNTDLAFHFCGYKQGFSMGREHSYGIDTAIVALCIHAVFYILLCLSYKLETCGNYVCGFCYCYIL